MTIIVDTCSLQAENSPAIFQTPKLRSYSPPMSPTYTIRESEDSCYDDAGAYITPRGMAKKALPVPPRAVVSADRGGRLEARTQNDEEEEREINSGDIFTGTNPGGFWEREREKQLAADKRMDEWEKKSGADRSKSRHLKSTISRFARAILYVLSAGTIQPPSKEVNKRSEKPKRGTPGTPQRTITMEAIRSNNSRANVPVSRALSVRRTVPISGRRGISPLPPVVLPAISLARNRHDLDETAMIPPELAFISTESRHSRSLPHVKFPSPIATEAFLLSAPSPVISTERGSRSQSFSSAPSPVIPTKRGSRSQSFSSPRNSRKLSIGSPRRPSLDSGSNAQYQSLNTGGTAIREVFDDLDGVTLGTRSRSGTGNTAFTNVSFTPTLVSLDVRHIKLTSKIIDNSC